MTTKEAALRWIGRGYLVVPVPHREKKPVSKEWEKLRLTAADVPKYFNGQPQNIGVLLGDRHNHTDVDLDCPEALVCAPLFLPETKLVFGRKSNPASHRFYRASAPLETIRFLDPIRQKDPATGKEKQDTILELRGRKRDGTIGLQTITPPSVHPSGELIRFEPNGDGAASKVDAAALETAVRHLAAAALLAKHFPGDGARHTAFLALAGMLGRSGLGEDAILRIHAAIYAVLWPGVRPGVVVGGAGYPAETGRGQRRHRLP